MITAHCPAHSCLAPSRKQPPASAAEQTRTIDAPRQPQAYTRLFPELPALEIDEELLYALGRQGGVCDGAPFAEGGTDDARGAAGWPFFGQFVAHDITADRSALVHHADVAALRNARRQKINLKEAEVCTEGDRLGAVGGRIVGEVLVGLVDHDPGSFRVAAPGWRPELPSAEAEGFTLADPPTFAGAHGD